MKKVSHQSAIDEQRRKLTRLLIGDLSIPAFSYDFKLDRKTMIAVMAGSKPYTDKLWDEVCSKTGLAQAKNSSAPKLRTNMERIHLLDEWLGNDNVELAAARLGIDPAVIYRYFTHTESLDARHAMKLAAALNLPQNYFEITPISSSTLIGLSPHAYSHRYPPRGINKDVLKNRSSKLRALIGEYNIHDFCRVFNLESRRIHAVLVGGAQMSRALCKQVTQALDLQSNFFDKPFADLDRLEILSAHDDMQHWPLIQQLRTLRRKTMHQLMRLEHYL